MWARRMLLAGMLGGAASAAGGLGDAFGVEPRWLAVRRLTVTLPRLPAAFERYQVVHLSDLHLAGASIPPVARIDYLLHSTALAARRAAVVPDSAGADHLPVVADLSLRH